MITNVDLFVLDKDMWSGEDHAGPPCERVSMKDVIWNVIVTPNVSNDNVCTLNIFIVQDFPHIDVVCHWFYVIQLSSCVVLSSPSKST